MIRIANVVKRFGAVRAVDGVSLEVGENEFVALLGPSGCGKTTLLRLIAGLEQPDEGRIFIGGADQTARPAYARPVNMMFQSYALFPHMTVESNVAFGLKQDGLAGAELKTRVREALASVEMDALAGRKPHQLSGGQRQRAALARCLAKRPRALLLDEPLAALDKHLRERTQLELMALRARLGISFIVVTHDQEEAMSMADRVVVMQAGRILQTGSPRDLYDRPASRAVAAFFGDINVWEGVVGSDNVRCAAPGITCATAETLPEIGATVAVAVRPEQIGLTRGHSGDGVNTAQGTVTAFVYRGTTSTYFVTTGHGAVVRVVRQNAGDAIFQRGDAVSLSWPAAAVRVLPA